MKANAREVLEKLGSKKAKHLGWRDMWAMVTKKGTGPGDQYPNLKSRILNKPSIAVEEYSRSTEFHSWGAPVSVTAEVPLTSPQGQFLTIV